MSDDVDYRILGDDLQIVEIELDLGETMIAEACRSYVSPFLVAMSCCDDEGSPKSGMVVW